MLLSSLCSSLPGAAEGATSRCRSIRALLPPLSRSAATIRRGIAGAPLPDSIVVKVTDADGNPLSGQRVVFVLADESPGALVTPDEAMTGADGTAAARWVLGGASGTQRVVARLVSDQAPAALEARFTASATLPPAGADRLVLRVQPSSSATAGTAFDRQPVIQIRDAERQRRDPCRCVGHRRPGLG